MKINETLKHYRIKKNIGNCSIKKSKKRDRNRCWSCVVTNFDNFLPSRTTRKIIFKDNTLAIFEKKSLLLVVKSLTTL